MATASPPSHPALRLGRGLSGRAAPAQVGAELVRVLAGAVDYEVLRAASDGDLAQVRRELGRLRGALDRAEHLLRGLDPDA